MHIISNDDYSKAKSMIELSASVHPLNLRASSFASQKTSFRASCGRSRTWSRHAIDVSKVTLDLVVRDSDQVLFRIVKCSGLHESDWTGARSVIAMAWEYDITSRNASMLGRSDSFFFWLVCSLVDAFGFSILTIANQCRQMRRVS